eukprot:GILJ01013364.1.p1 GENE.GILJ01013364.1~~GILJ01013364.1.p1  ORF type:complete len:211 (-),score=42.13 GILJ01013364.1:32-664(-)
MAKSIKEDKRNVAASDSDDDAPEAISMSAGKATAIAQLQQEKEHRKSAGKPKRTRRKAADTEAILEAASERLPEEILEQAQTDETPKKKRMRVEENEGEEGAVNESFFWQDAQTTSAIKQKLRAPIQLGRPARKSSNTIKREGFDLVVLSRMEQQAVLGSIPAEVKAFEATQLFGNRIKRARSALVMSQKKRGPAIQFTRKRSTQPLEPK